MKSKYTIKKKYKTKSYEVKRVKRKNVENKMASSLSRSSGKQEKQENKTEV